MPRENETGSGRLGGERASGRARARERAREREVHATLAIRLLVYIMYSCTGRRKQPSTDSTGPALKRDEDQCIGRQGGLGTAPRPSVAPPLSIVREARQWQRLILS